MASYATPELLQNYLKQVEMNEEVHDLFTKILDRATSIVDGALGALPNTNFFAGYTSATTKKARGYGAYLVPPPHEIGSITLVVDVDGNNLVGYWEELEDGTLYAIDSNGVEWDWGNGRYTITADYGNGTVPSSVVEVVLELATNIWRSKDSGQFSNVVGVQGGGAVGYEGALTPRQKMILRDIKQQYREIVV